MDSNPTVLIIGSIDAEMSGSGFFISGSNPATIDFFYLQGTNTVLGTYDFGFQGPGNTMGIENGDLFPNSSFPNTYQFQLNNWPSVGGYIDISFSGTFFDNGASPTQHTVSGTIHVIRDI